MKAQVMKIAHQIAKADKLKYDFKSFGAKSAYSFKFKLALKKAWKEVKNNSVSKSELASYEELAIKAILKGGFWNGQFYGKFTYVSNQKYQVNNLSTFVSELSKRAGAGFIVRNSNDIKNINKRGFDAIER